MMIRTAAIAATIALTLTAACDAPSHSAPAPNPLFNCLTMGNRTCGPNYKMVDDLPHPAIWISIIADQHPGYDPYRCLISTGDDSDITTIVCQDGFISSY